MFYRALVHTPNPQQELIYLSDPRAPGEMGAALAANGYLTSLAGEATWAGFNAGDVTVKSFSFRSKGQVVLFARHLIRLDEVVIEPGTQVSES